MGLYGRTQEEIEELKLSCRREEEVALSLNPKKKFKKSINKIVRSLFLYNFGILVIGIIYYILVSGIFYAPGGVEEELYNPLQNFFLGDGLISIVGIVFSFLLLIYLLRKEDLQDSIFIQEKRMTLIAFLSFFCINIACQSLFTYCNLALEIIFNHFGFTMQEALASATDPGEDFVTILYTALLAPFFEELIYRGFAIRYLERYGKVFAIILSAFLFGVMHGNIPQGLFAFFIGLLYGYIALEYSVFWTFIMHFINNFGLGFLYSKLLYNLSDTAVVIMDKGMEVFAVVLTLFLIIKNRNKISAYFKKNKSRKKAYIYSFTSIWIIIFFAFHALIAFTMIKSL